MKRRKLLGILVLICIFATACASKDSANQSKSAPMEEAAVTQEAAAGTESYATSADTADVAMDTTAESKTLTTTNDSGTSTELITNQKLIKNVYMDVETKEFDTLLENLSKKVTEMKGYIESSQVSGNSYEYESMRYASLTIRIPSNLLDQFVSVVEKDANVTNKTEGTQDVTLQYVDMSSHVEALRAEQKSLMKILEAATKIEDIIQIQAQLTQVRYEIESYESQLRTYDNLVDYSTVTVSINEVKRETSTQTESFAEKISARFTTNLYNIGQGFQAFIIWLISSIPYILIWAVVIILFVFIYRKAVPKMKGRKHLNKTNDKVSSKNASEKEE